MINIERATRHSTIKEDLQKRQSINQAATFKSTRVLVNVGKRFPNIVRPVFTYSLASDTPSIQLLSLYEIFELGATMPGKATQILSDFFQDSFFRQLVAQQNILAALGKVNIFSAINYFEKALNSRSPLLQLQAVHEILSLIDQYPTQLIPLISLGVESKNVDAKWLSLIWLITSANKYPAQIKPYLAKILHKVANSSCVFKQSIIALETHDPQLIYEKIKALLLSHHKKEQWEGALILIDLINKNPEKYLSLLKLALRSTNPHVRWLSMLCLFELHKMNPKLIQSLITTLLPKKNKENRSQQGILSGLYKKKLISAPEAYCDVLELKDSRLQIILLYELFTTHINKPRQFYAALSTLLRNHPTTASHIHNARLLVELASQNEQLVADTINAIYDSKKMEASLYDAIFLEVCAICHLNQQFE